MELLRKYRTENKLTHQKMAEMLKISKPFYWQIENDNRRLSYEMAMKISRIFNLKPDQLFYEEMKAKQNKE